MKKTWLPLLIAGMMVMTGCVKKEALKKKGSLKYKNEKSEGRADVGEDVKLPSNFPKDVPIYSGAKIIAAITNKSDQAEMIVVTLQTNNSFKEAAKYYEDKLVKNGYDIKNRFETDANIALTAEKDDKTVVAATANENGKTTIGINITIKNQ